MMMYDPTPGYESRLGWSGWAKFKDGEHRVCGGEYWKMDDVQGSLHPRFWERRGEKQATVGPFRVESHGDSPVSQERIQATFEATLNLLGRILAEDRAEHGGGSFKVVLAGGGQLHLPDSFRRAMAESDVGVEILNPDGSTSVVPPPD